LAVDEEIFVAHGLLQLVVVCDLPVPMIKREIDEFKRQRVVRELCL
jgi:hypothetical protein